MPLVVHKFPLQLMEEQEILLDVGAEILHVDDQEGTLTLWAVVNNHPDAERLGCRVLVVGTGHEVRIPPQWHVGTVLMRSSGSVWHVFAGWHRRRGA